MKRLAAEVREAPRSLGPSTGLVAAGAVVLGLACLAPAGAAMLHLAQAAAVVFTVVALADGWWAHKRTPRYAVELAEAEERTTQRLRFTAGKKRMVRLRLTERGAPRKKNRELRVAWMAADSDLETHATLPVETARLKLGPGKAWECEAELTGVARGACRGLRVGLERSSPLAAWRVRSWHTLAAQVRVYPDMEPGRRELMRSPVSRTLLASAQAPTLGQGHEFERIREYQAGDYYADINWKATARRNFPVTNLYQWEREQEIVFVLDHSRLAHHLDRAIETVLAGAAAALAAGDRIGLITFADRVTGWLSPKTGAAQMAACRELLAGLEARRVQPDYETLFAAIQTRLRRRAYLLLLANLAEPALAEPFCQAAAPVTRTHLLAAQCVLPEGTRRMFEGPAAETIEDVYGALAGDLEWQRLRELRARLARQGIQFRAVPAERYLRTAVEGYLETKRRQRL